MFPEFFESAMAEADKENSPAASPSSGSNSTVFVISVGGSLLFDETGGPNISAFQKIAGSIAGLHREGNRFAVVVGGGRPARFAIEAAKEARATLFECDELGILATRQNALLFSKFLPNSRYMLPTKLLSIGSVLKKNTVPVMGGLFPGHTTDAVAALLAEKWSGTVVNLSNVDGVYSSDPKTNSRARLYRELSFEKLFEIVAKQSLEPGTHVPLDLLACMIVKRSKVPVIFVNGNTLENFESAVQGKPFNGTVVQESEEETGEASASDEKL
ncbi:MAG: UMP kinase [Candidatus Micrarchaeota archaeon]